MLYRWVREQEGNPSKVDGSKNEAALEENSSACVVSWPRPTRRTIS
jgi:hypothetical protein